MGYIITNLTDSSRGENFQHNDLLRYTYDNGTIIEKYYFSPQITTNEVEMKAKGWRNDELQKTDFIVPLTDYPNRTAWMTYRQELRDWPSTDDFPDTKPIKP